MTRQNGGDRLDAAEAMMKAQGGRCAVCDAVLIYCWQAFVEAGAALCDPCMRKWRRGTLDRERVQKALPL